MPEFPETITKHPIQAIVVGGSAGGIDAMLTIFSALPATFHLPIIALVHVPSERKSRLAEAFQHKLAIPVKEAEDKEEIQAAHLYFASSGYHLSIEKDHTFSFSCEPPVHFSRPSIDILMESAAESYKQHLLGVLLSGANHDGAQGLKTIKDYGGITVVQDPEEAQVATMPREAIKQHAPDYILNLSQIRHLFLMLERN